MAIVLPATVQLFVLVIAGTATCTVAGAAMLGATAPGSRRALWLITVAGSATLLLALDAPGVPAVLPAATAAATLALPYIRGRRAAIVLGGVDAAVVGGCAGYVAARSYDARPGWYVLTAAAIAIVVAVALGAGVGLLTAPARGRTARGRAARLRLLGAMVLGALVLPATLVLAVVPAGPPAPTSLPGIPLLTSAAIEPEPVTVLVAPGRPGWNLIHLGVTGASVGVSQTRLVLATPRPATGYGWAAIYLPPGRSQIWVGHGGQAAPVTVDTGTGPAGPDLRGPDGPECASVALGLALSHSNARLTTCPADQLDSADATALRGIMRFIAGRGIHAISLVADSSPRGTAARALISAQAARYRITVGEPALSRPMVIVSGWGPALAAVRDVGSGRSLAQGTYLAPWLLNSEILGPPAGQLIPLRFDPAAQPALTYLAAMYSRFPDEAASEDGYLAWSGASVGPLRLYASSTIAGASMGGMVGMVESGQTMPAMPAIGSSGWLPDGSIVPVTGSW